MMSNNTTEAYNPDTAAFIDKLTALGESEMQLFRMLLDKPYGVILTVETDIVIAKLLARDDLVWLEEGSHDEGSHDEGAREEGIHEEGAKVIIPEDTRNKYREIWTDELTLKWRKRNWMYKCLEAGKYLYGVMTWDVLKSLFALRYPSAKMAEIREIFDTTPSFYQWFTERSGKLVLNGYEKDDYYIYLETEVQGDVPFYIPAKEEVEELYERGCLISRENHAKLQDFIAETFGCDKDTASLKVHELYEGVNNRVRMNDAVEAFTEGFAEFPSDESQVKFIELYIEMSRECRIRDNRGHDYYEMVGIMAKKNSASSGGPEKKAPVKRVKIGRNEPCPCGSGKKYKNCCGKS